MLATPDEELSRRTFLLAALRLAGAFAAVGLAGGLGALAAPARRDGHAWALEVHRLAGELAAGRLGQRRWQHEIVRVSGELDLDELLSLLDFERLLARLEYPAEQAAVQPVRLAPIQALPRVPGFGTKIFAMRRGGAIVPHGHDNMASMHLVLRGRFHALHYDRLEDEPGHLTLRPTIDRVLAAGEATTISDAQDNVHWFTALTDEAVTLDVVVVNLDPARPEPWRLHFVDPAGARPLGDGRLRARRLEPAEAFALYWKPR